MATKIKALQMWCKKMTDGYRDVNVTDFTTSWRSGLAFCAMIHRFRPDLIDYDSLSKENVFDNNHLAFTVAEKELDIPAFLEAADMVALKTPDKLSVITYVSQYYNKLGALPQLGGPGVKGKTSVAHAATVAGTKRHQQSEPLSEPETKKQPSPARQAEEAKPKVRTLGDRCAICKNKVYLLERHVEDGQLYHRSCYRHSDLSPTNKIYTQSPFLSPSLHGRDSMGTPTASLSSTVSSLDQATNVSKTYAVEKGLESKNGLKRPLVDERHDEKNKKPDIQKALFQDGHLHHKLTLSQSSGIDDHSRNNAEPFQASAKRTSSSDLLLSPAPKLDASSSDKRISDFLSLDKGAADTKTTKRQLPLIFQTADSAGSSSVSASSTSDTNSSASTDKSVGLFSSRLDNNAAGDKPPHKMPIHAKSESMLKSESAEHGYGIHSAKGSLLSTVKEDSHAKSLSDTKAGPVAKPRHNVFGPKETEVEMSAAAVTGKSDSSYPTDKSQHSFPKPAPRHAVDESKKSVAKVKSPEASKRKQTGTQPSARESSPKPSSPPPLPNSAPPPLTLSSQSGSSAHPLPTPRQNKDDARFKFFSSSSSGAVTAVSREPPARPSPPVSSSNSAVKSAGAKVQTMASTSVTTSSSSSVFTSRKNLDVLPTKRQEEPMEVDPSKKAKDRELPAIVLHVPVDKDEKDKGLLTGLLKSLAQVRNTPASPSPPTVTVSTSTSTTATSRNTQTASSSPLTVTITTSTSTTAISRNTQAASSSPLTVTVTTSTSTIATSRNTQAASSSPLTVTVTTSTSKTATPPAITSQHFDKASVKPTITTSAAVLEPKKSEPSRFVSSKIDSLKKKGSEQNINIALPSADTKSKVNHVSEGSGSTSNPLVPKGGPTSGGLKSSTEKSAVRNTNKVEDAEERTPVLNGKPADNVSSWKKNLAEMYADVESHEAPSIDKIDTAGIKAQGQRDRSKSVSDVLSTGKSSTLSVPKTSVTTTGTPDRPLFTQVKLRGVGSVTPETKERPKSAGTVLDTGGESQTEWQKEAERRMAALRDSGFIDPEARKSATSDNVGLVSNANKFSKETSPDTAPSASIQNTKISIDLTKGVVSAHVGKSTEPAVVISEENKKTKEVTSEEKPKRKFSLKGILKREDTKTKKDKSNANTPPQKPQRLSHFLDKQHELDTSPVAISTSTPKDKSPEEGSAMKGAEPSALTKKKINVNVDLALSPPPRPASPPKPGRKKISVDLNFDFNSSNSVDLSAKSHSVLALTPPARPPPPTITTPPSRMSAIELQKQLLDIDQKLSQLELRGRDLEDSIRSVAAEAAEDNLMVEWFQLVTEKNDLVRLETDLVYMSREQDLMDEQSQLESQLQYLLYKDESDKSLDEKQEEEYLIQRKLDIVNQRNYIVDSMDEDRQRYEEEDRDIAQMLHKKGYLPKSQ